MRFQTKKIKETKETPLFLPIHKNFFCQMITQLKNISRKLTLFGRKRFQRHFRKIMVRSRRFAIVHWHKTTFPRTDRE